MAPDRSLKYGVGFSFSKPSRSKEAWFLHKQSSKTSPHSGREGETLTALPVEGATQAPAICSVAECERRSPLEQTSVFVGNATPACHNTALRCAGTTPIDIPIENPNFQAQGELA